MFHITQYWHFQRVTTKQYWLIQSSISAISRAILKLVYWFWDPKPRPPKTLTSVKINNSSKNRKNDRSLHYPTMCRATRVMFFELFQHAKIVKNNLRHWNPHWGGLTNTPPDSPAGTMVFFSSLWSIKKTGTPQKKTAGYSTAHIKHCSHFHRVITKQ